MGDRAQRLKGKTEESSGKLKATVGHDTRNGSAEAKGAAKVTKGKARGLLGKTRSAVKKHTR